METWKTIFPACTVTPTCFNRQFLLFVTFLVVNLCTVRTHQTRVLSYFASRQRFSLQFSKNIATRKHDLELSSLGSGSYNKSSPFTTSVLQPRNLSIPSNITSSPSFRPLDVYHNKNSSCGNFDKFGIQKLYTSSSKSDDDWYCEWSEEAREISSKSVRVDPIDRRTEIRGSGSARIKSGTAIFRKSPALFISKRNGTDGFENVEMTGYAKYLSDGQIIKGHSGLNMLVRTNRDDRDGCLAPSYWAQLNRETGNAVFQKEYFRDDNYGPVRGRKIQVRVSQFSGGLPLGKWIGMKFVVYSVGSENVKLELYADFDEESSVEGGNWTLVHSFLDTPNAWKASSRVPAHCEHENGSTILGQRSFCILQNMGDDSTMVAWKKVSVRNIVQQKFFSECSSISTSKPTALPTSTKKSAQPSFAPSGVFTASPIPTQASSSHTFRSHPCPMAIVPALSANTTASLAFSAVEEEMDDKVILSFESATLKYLRKMDLDDSFCNISVSISSLRVVSQAIVPSEEGTRSLKKDVHWERKVEGKKEKTQLSVSMIVYGVVSSTESHYFGDRIRTLFVDNESEFVRNLTEAVPFFKDKIDQLPNDSEKQPEKNVSPHQMTNVSDESSQRRVEIAGGLTAIMAMALVVGIALVIRRGNKNLPPARIIMFPRSLTGARSDSANASFASWPSIKLGVPLEIIPSSVPQSVSCLGTDDFNRPPSLSSSSSMNYSEDTDGANGSFKRKLLAALEDAKKTCPLNDDGAPAHEMVKNGPLSHHAENGETRVVQTQETGIDSKEEAPDVPKTPTRNDVLASTEPQDSDYIKESVHTNNAPKKPLTYAPTKKKIPSTRSFGSVAHIDLSEVKRRFDKQLYEVRAPPGPLGIVVDSSRQGPKVYKIKPNSPLVGLIDEGDNVLSIDMVDTRRMTALSLSKWIRDRGDDAEWVITLLGKTDSEGTSVEYSV